ncbi:TBB [Symbiodinium necroappetens]|uniref:TBB protein n=1 Tax=Symbiodinium necroappetens TaxID=1628268 RepID=A0A812WZZ4_9DINO|nr:TBB [Symbiodinium necroappetens]
MSGEHGSGGLYGLLKVPELRCEVRRRGLDPVGTRKELTQRLIAHDWENGDQSIVDPAACGRSQQVGEIRPVAAAKRRIKRRRRQIGDSARVEGSTVSVHPQETAVKLQESDDSLQAETGFDLAEDELRQAMQKLLSAHGQQQASPLAPNQCADGPDTATEAASEAVAVVSPEVEALKFQVQRAMKRTAQAQMRLRRKKAEEILLTGLLKHCEAACKVYRLRSDAT